MQAALAICAFLALLHLVEPAPPVGFGIVGKKADLIEEGRKFILDHVDDPNYRFSRKNLLTLKDLPNYTEEKCNREYIRQTDNLVLQLTKKDLPNKLTYYGEEHMAKQVEFCQDVFDRMLKEGVAKLDGEKKASFENLLELRNIMLSIDEESQHIGRAESLKELLDRGWIRSELLGKAFGQFFSAHGIKIEPKVFKSHEIDQIKELIAKHFGQSIDILKTQFATARDFLDQLKSASPETVLAYRQEIGEWILLFIIQDKLALEREDVLDQAVRFMPKTKASKFG